MKSIKQQYTRGVLAILVGVLFAVSGLVAPAHAQQSTTDLQLMINELLARISALESGQTTVDSVSSSTVCPYNWTRSLGQGARGSDVQQLQRFLNNDPDTRVAQTGAGSIGQETQYYGPLTAAAVSRFQLKYRNEVLTPLGLVNPTGYFGPSSRGKANALCVSAPTPTPTPDDEDEEEEEEEDDRELRGGEASLEDFEGSDGDDTNLEEGQNNAPVAEFEFDVEDGDVRLSRVDVAFRADAGNEEDEPWDVFEDVSLWVDGDKIAEENADDEDDWNEDDPVNGTHSIRFAGLDQIFEEDETAKIVVAVSVQGSIDGADTGEAWEVFIPRDGIRARDSVGIDQYVGDTSDSNPTEGVDFTIDEEGGDDELKIQSSSDDPNATTFRVEESSNSDWYTVFAFDLDTDDSTNDIEVETAVVTVTVTGDVYNDVVNDARLVIDGDEYDDFEVTNGGTDTATLTFDIDKDLVIDAGDEVLAELELEFKRQSGNYNEGQTVEASTNETGWEAEGADDLDVGSQLDGAANGETHTLRTQGVSLEVEDTSASVDENDDADTTDNEGVFEIEFSVTAFEADVYIDDTAGRGTSATTSGVSYLIESGGSTVTTGSTVDNLDSSADLVSGRFRVNEGDTETFTLTVIYDPSAANDGDFAKLQLYAVNFNTANAAPDESQRALPAEDFDTRSISI